MDLIKVKILMKLENIRWEDHYLICDNMFHIKKYGTVNTTSIGRRNAVFDVVGATSKNNGNVLFANKKYKDKLVKKNAICLIKTGEGSVGDAVYKGNDFIPSNNVSVIEKDTLDRYFGLFTVALINKCSDRYSYGYIRNDKRISREKILLPTTSHGKPDYAFMEQFMRAKEQEKLEEYAKFAHKKLDKLKDYKEVKPLNEKEWKEFSINNIFIDIQRGKRLKKDNHKIGKIPYVSSTAMNNGVDCFVGNKDSVRVFSDCITIANSGSVGASFYQPFSFVASDHVTKLHNPNFNRYVYLFISQATKRFGEKYSFNREINDDRIKREKILLPINSKNEPDYEYMENYIKKIEFEKLSQYLKYKKDLKQDEQ